MPTSSVRYYEPRKLLEPTTRSSGNYRMNDCEMLERLLFIRSAQHAGFTLCDSSSLLEFRDGDDIGHLKRPFKFQFTNASITAWNVITLLELELGFDFDVFIGRDILPSE